jgi:hypothetical protein
MEPLQSGGGRAMYRKYSCDVGRMTGISSRRTSKIIISPGFMSANPIGAPSERI